MRGARFWDSETISGRWAVTEQASSRAFNLRSFVAFMVTWSFLAAVVTGIILFVVPQGRIANWVEWSLFGLTKDDWAGIHISFTFIFIIAGILHLYPYNWKQWKHYLAERVGNRLNFARPKMELLLSVVLSAFVVVGSIADWPPMNYLYQANDWAKAAWVIEAAYEPPFGHAEEVSLATFAKKQDMDLAAAEEALRAKGLVYGSDRDSLGKIAAANGISAMDVYAVIKPLERRAGPTSDTVYTEERVEDLFTGTGVGGKTVATLCAEAKVDCALALRRLADRDILARPEDDMKSIGDSAGIRPTDVLKIMLVAPPSEAEASPTLTADDIVMKFEGAGVGRMTLAQACEKLGISVDVALSRLKGKGHEAQADETLKAIGDRLGGRPMDALLAIALD